MCFIHSYIHSYRIYPYKSVTKNLELGFFTEYLENNSGAELPFTFYLLALYILLLNLQNGVFSRLSHGYLLSVAISNTSAKTGRGKSFVFPLLFPHTGCPVPLGSIYDRDAW